MIFLSVTHTVRTPSLSGTQTVTQGLATGLPEAVPISWLARRADFHTLPPKWSRKLGRTAAPSRLQVSSLLDLPLFLRAWGFSHRVPLDRHPGLHSQLAGAWLLMPELMDGFVVSPMIQYAKRHRMRTAAIFHDAIPLQRPDLTNRPAARHTAYIEALNECDLVLPVSAASEAAFREFGGHARTRVCPLPAEFIGRARVTEVSAVSDPVNILCVSTLEPRKNHDTLLAAFARASAGTKRMTLHLAGERYEKMPALSERIETSVRQNPLIHWHERPSPQQLGDLYGHCDLTVYPSILEGFGLPVVESLWFGKPCICANFGVMAENAAGGGCLTVDVRDEKALAEAILLLATQPETRRRLSLEATTRPLRSWREYAQDVATALG